jgi:serine phosphatase RsbU (regulator of sigma subunit)
MRKPRALAGSLVLLAWHLVAWTQQARADVPVTAASMHGPTGQDLREAGWRFSPGDDLRWAGPAWDDSGWVRLASTRAGPETAAPAATGIGWYRLRLDVAPEVAGPLALQLWHWGASEVYLDGQPVGGFGRVAATPAQERTQNPRWRAVILPVRSSGPHVLALRYSAWPQTGPSRRARWLRSVTPPGVNVRLMPASTYLLRRDRDHTGNTALLTALAVAFTGFAALHLLYWLLDRSDRQNLAFVGYAAALAGIIGWQVHRELVDHTVQAGAWLESGAQLLLALMGLSLVGFVFASRRRRTPRLAVVIAGTQASLLPLALVAPDLRWFAPLGATCQLVLVGMALVAAARSREDAAQGRAALCLSALAGSTPLVMTAFETLGVPLAAASRALLIEGGLAVVLVLASIAQARRFAITSRDLRRQLAQIRELSARERERDRAEAEARVERERERAELERHARELDEARAFQLSLLPAQLPDLPGWEAVASMQTASEVGGDYFDIRRQPNGVATLVIGDATGHGLRAGTLVAATKGLFQAVGDHENLGTALQVMSSAMRDLRLRGLFMTLTMLRLHLDGRVEITSAGMPAAIWLRANGDPEAVSAPAPPLGAPIRFEYRTRHLQLAAGDRLVLMSDGVPERLDGQDALFGYDRVPTLLAAHALHRGKAFIHAVEAALDGWAGRPPADDATLLVITRR